MRRLTKRPTGRPTAAGGPRPVTGERVSEFFKPANGLKFVRRSELLALLTQFHKASRQNTWGSKLWRWLTAPRGSGSVHAVEPPTPKQDGS